MSRVSITEEIQALLEILEREIRLLEMWHPMREFMCDSQLFEVLRSLSDYSTFEMPQLPQYKPQQATSLSACSVTVPCLLSMPSP